MAISMSLWSIGKGQSLKSVSNSKLNFENDLENWIINDPTILDLDLMTLGRQVHTDYGGYIDILAINREGDLVIVELKRNRTPRDVIAQCLDYASWVSDLSYEKIKDLYKKHSGNGLEESYQSFFDDQLPETLNENHQIVIVAASLDDATERIIQYLADKHSININAVFFNVFDINGNQILGRSWLKDPEFIDNIISKPSTGYLFVNTGIKDGRAREWNLNTKFAYVSAGGGARWISAIRKLKAGDKIFAYIKGFGYVGYGIVEEEAVPVSEYEIEGKRIVDALPDGHPWKKLNPTSESGEWLSKVKWIKTFPKEQAKWLSNGFANQNVVCKLRDRRTFDFLVKEFDIDPERIG